MTPFKYEGRVFASRLKRHAPRELHLTRSRGDVLLCYRPHRHASVALGRKTREEGKPTVLDVFVKPASKRPGIAWENGTLVVRVRERAIDGAANDACAQALAAAYDVAPSAVELLSGARSRRKRFAIAGATGTPFQ